MKSKALKYVDINPDSQPLATVIWLHGLGVDGHDFVPLVSELRIPDTLPIRFIFPHAPRRRVTINNQMVMPAWFDVLAIQKVHRVNLDHIQNSAELLTDLITHELLPCISTERILLAGFSQGGTIALHAGLRFEKKLAGILALSTYLPSVDNLEEERRPANLNIPIMMAHGRKDPLISIESAIATRNELTRLGYRIDWREYPVEHTVCYDEIQDIRTWLLNIVKTPPAEREASGSPLEGG